MTVLIRRKFGGTEGHKDVGTERKDHVGRQ